MSDHASKPAGHFDCSQTVALLFPYLDHELDSGEREAVQTHLARCGPCADLFRFEGNILRLCGERLARVQAPPKACAAGSAGSASAARRAGDGGRPRAPGDHRRRHRRPRQPGAGRGGRTPAPPDRRRPAAGTALDRLGRRRGDGRRRDRRHPPRRHPDRQAAPLPDARDGARRRPTAARPARRPPPPGRLPAARPLQHRRLRQRAGRHRRALLRHPLPDPRADRHRRPRQPHQRPLRHPHRPLLRHLARLAAASPDVGEGGRGRGGEGEQRGEWESPPLPLPPSPLPRPRAPAPLVVTGNPIRPEILAGRPERALAALGLRPGRPVVYLTGGARGSHALNEAVAGALPDLLTLGHLVHQTGPVEANGDLPRLEALAAGLPEALRAGYRPRAFVGPDLPDLYALADLVVGRAGAGTVTELAALGKPSLLIPLPGTSADEQTRNARLLADASAAVLLPEPDLTPARLTAEIAALLADPARLRRLGEAARQFACPDAAARLVDHLLDLAARPGPTRAHRGR